MEKIGVDADFLSGIIFRLVDQIDPCDFTNIVDLAKSALELGIPDFQSQVNILNSASGRDFKFPLADQFKALSRVGKRSSEKFSIALDLALYWDAKVLPDLNKLVGSAEVANELEKEDRPRAFLPQRIDADSTKFVSECRA